MQKKCPNCPRTYAMSSQVCPFCGTRYEAGVAAARAAGRETPPPGAGVSGPAGRNRGIVVMGADVSKARRSSGPVQVGWGWVLALVATILFSIWTFRPKRLPLQNLKAVSDPTALVCNGRPVCVVVYVAPWDPVSRETIKTVRRLRDDWADSDELGLAVVVGHDTPDRIADLAEVIGEDVWMDYGGTVFKTAEIETVPMWFRVDSTGKVKDRVEGTFRPLEYQLQKLGFTAG